MIRKFLKRLKEIAPKYEWALVHHGFLIRGRQKGAGGGTVMMQCPISAVAQQSGSATTSFMAGEPRVYGKAGLTGAEAHKILRAADLKRMPWRKALLKAVGLKEES